MKIYQHVFFGITIGLIVAILVTLIKFKIHEIQLYLGVLTSISALIYGSDTKEYPKKDEKKV